MAIIDVLRGEFVASVGFNPAVLNDDNSLTVDNTFTHVDLENLAGPNTWAFVYRQYGTNYRHFQAKDNLIILSAGIFLPYHFISADPLPAMNFLSTNDALADWNNLSQLSGGVSASIVLPAFGYELSLNIFVPSPYTVQYSIGSKTFGSVSMIGVPASLNSGDLIYPTPFIKILHTLPMVA